jgi:hypothetical protein
MLGVVQLLKDDRSAYRDESLVNEELAGIQGSIRGEYVVNVVNYFPTSGEPQTVTVRVDSIVNGVETIWSDELTLERRGQEETAIRFTIGGKTKDRDPRFSREPLSIVAILVQERASAAP